jgi:very-short-patch-repair endonuclease
MERALRGLRRDASFQQQKLWLELRRKSLDGFKFRRQHPLLGVVVDFYCPQRNLVIEVDEDADADDFARDAMLVGHGLVVLRFANDEVDADVDAVVDEVRRALQAQSEKLAA